MLLHDEASTDKIWSIISNKEAIAINQAWAGHPGRQIKTISPAGPAVVGGQVYALPCNDSDTTQKERSYDAKSKVVRGPGGKCLDSTSGAETPQQFTIGDDGTIDSVAEVGQCVDIYAAHGLPGEPGVQLYGCHGAPNEKFTFNRNGTLSSQEKVCLAGRAAAPQSLDVVEIWAKPLGGGKVAAFALNDGDNVTVTLDLSDFVSTSQAMVRDVWAKHDLGKMTNAITVNLGKRDSAMFVLSPVAENLHFV